MTFFKSDWPIIKYILFLYVLTRLVLTCIGYYSKTNHIASNPSALKWNFTENKVFDIWGVWDSGYFLDLAKRGYSQDQNYQFPIKLDAGEYGKHQTNFQFFPLYSIFIRIFNFLVDNYYYSALIISNSSFLMSTYLLYKLVNLFYSQQIAKTAVLYMFLFPTGFIYSGVFSESLALLFILLTFYLSFQKKYVKAGFAASAALLTKTAGITSLVSLIPSKLSGQNIKKIVVSFAVPFIAFITFLFYEYKISGNPFIYFQTAANGWGVQIVNPVQMFLTLIFGTVPPHLEVGRYAVLAFIVFEAFLLYNFYSKIPMKLWFYWLITFLLPLTSGSAASFSTPRHTLLLFPQFIALSLLSKGNSIKIPLGLLMLLLQLYLMSLWVNGIAII